MLQLRSLLPLLILAVATTSWADDARPLFNGRDLSGWHGIPDTALREVDSLPPEERARRVQEWTRQAARHWRVEDGQLINDGQGPYLATDEQYEDFELRLEFRLTPGADSGVYLRGIPQVQIWDTTDRSKFEAGADKGSGGLWNNRAGAPGQEPLVRADRPIGEWNSLRVVMVGAYVTVWLNDRLVVDHAILQNPYERGRPVPRQGPIILQTHGGEIGWREITLREIPAEEANEILRRGGPARQADDDGGEGEEWVSLFNGRDFTGWRGPTDRNRVEDGAIISTTGNLYTEEEYGDFAVRLEFLLPPAGNNGLAIRYSGEGDPAYQGMCELQVLDTPAYEERGIDPQAAHASPYGLASAEQGYLRPVGEWNYQEVLVVGHRIQVELNGFPVLDVDMSDLKDPLFDLSRFPQRLRLRGHFGLAGHNDPVRFRRIEIRPLD